MGSGEARASAGILPSPRAARLSLIEAAETAALGRLSAGTSVADARDAVTSTGSATGIEPVAGDMGAIVAGASGVVSILGPGIAAMTGG